MPKQPKPQVHVGAYVVEGTDSILTASEAVRRAQTWKRYDGQAVVQMTCRGERVRVTMRGHEAGRRGRF